MSTGICFSAIFSAIFNIFRAKVPIFVAENKTVFDGPMGKYPFASIESSRLNMRQKTPARLKDHTHKASRFAF